MDPLAIVLLVFAAIVAVATLFDPHETALPDGADDVTVRGQAVELPSTPTALAWPRWTVVMVLCSLAVIAEALT